MSNWDESYVMAGIKQKPIRKTDSRVSKIKKIRGANMVYFCKNSLPKTAT